MGLDFLLRWELNGSCLSLAHREDMEYPEVHGGVSEVSAACNWDSERSHLGFVLVELFITLAGDFL